MMMGTVLGWVERGLGLTSRKDKTGGKFALPQQIVSKFQRTTPQDEVIGERGDAVHDVVLVVQKQAVFESAFDEEGVVAVVLAACDFEDERTGRDARELKNKIETEGTFQDLAEDVDIWMGCEGFT